MTVPAPDRQWRRAWGFLAATVVVGCQAMAALLAMVVCVGLVVPLPLLPHVVRFARRLAAGERDRVGRHLATTIPPPPAVPGTGVTEAVTSPNDRRDVQWLALQGTLGLFAGLVAIGSPAGVAQNLFVAAFWPFLPGASTTFDSPVASWAGAGVAVLVAAAYGLLGVVLVPPLARWWARTSAARLAPSKRTLTERLAEVTATRAAALEAHGAELRRIERSLHDGTQNRIVAVVMHLGMVERALTRDPAAALPVVIAAREAATDALAELREVVRAIYPPVLADRGLTGAVASLVAHCAIPCALEEHPIPRLPAAVEAAAYFVAAEALTNAVKHSGADRITVSLRHEDDVLVVEVTDDGRGGADRAHGSGLTGIRGRVAAFDGTTRIDSPPGGPTVVRVDIPAGP
ncbi:sensor histidine kinase [Actinokineospora spheciospongiae]|uniref:sensor histidine kinase n=1 Tax=Actinokineospora spheciospongiae TaxID=909613 RepID=UPI000D70D23D|nr:sensor histidine kinase [Actinokineospora spheciospongiae]PWW58351.1 signal transduction histidine kinase [Actinokineospora spheciospongiae]